MKLLIDIQSNLFERIKILIENKEYSSVSDFFSAAAENQLMLEKTPVEELNFLAQETALNGKDKNTIISKKNALSIPSKDKIKTFDIPADERLLYPTRKSEQDLYLWGQINRIFPIKVGLRVLANLLAEMNTPYIKYEEFSAKASKNAQELRSTLEKNKHMSEGKSSLAIGLPQKTEKSIMRYKNQFLGYLRKDLIIEGGLGRLKFANLIIKDKGVVIGITEPGLDFCMLENPILDKNTYEKETLSESEKEFYLNHIVSLVPYEVHAFLDVLKLVKAEVQNPESQNKELKKIWPEDWKESIINTQRNGVISRLDELDLIEKSKKGIRVEYKITNRGHEFLKMKGGKL